MIDAGSLPPRERSVFKRELVPLGHGLFAGRLTRRQTDALLSGGQDTNSGSAGPIKVVILEHWTPVVKEVYWKFGRQKGT